MLTRMSDIAWPCRCSSCCPSDRCEACGVAAGQVCDATCSGHPRNRAPCTARRDAEPEPKIARGEA